jgi:hypothetical protein
MLTPLLARLRRNPRNVRKPRRPPNPSEAARTLEYEFNMLGVAVEECRKEHAPPYGDMALEAFLLHARNLVGFFQGSSDRGDILAIDWLKTSTTFPLPILNKTLADIHKLLGHPSYSRGKRHRTWRYDAMYLELAGNWRAFLKQLATDEPNYRRLFK